MIGEYIHEWLMKEGGFVYTSKNGDMSIHFNRGRKPSKDLVDALVNHKAALKAYVIKMHAGMGWGAGAFTPPPALGTVKPFLTLACKGERDGNLLTNEKEEK